MSFRAKTRNPEKPVIARSIEKDENDVAISVPVKAVKADLPQRTRRNAEGGFNGRRAIPSKALKAALRLCVRMNLIRI